MLLRFMAIVVVATMVSAGALRCRAEAPADTVVAAAALQEVTVSAVGPRKLVRVLDGGDLRISSDMLSEHVSAFGSNDPLGLIRSLPAVSTANELSASLSVKGMDNGANYFTTDGVRVVNPLHLFGLYSTFNPAYYKSYRFASGRFPATSPNFTGGLMEADSGSLPDTILSGTVAVGLIESHVAVASPIVKGKTSFSAAIRQTYLHLVYPGLLKFRDSGLNYKFTDANAGFRWSPTENDLLSVNLFFSRDQLVMELDRHGEKEGSCGWKNICGGIGWTHSDLQANLGISYFDNSFILSEGGRSINLPSSVAQATLSAEKPFGEFLVESDLSLRHCSGQYNHANSRPADAGGSDAVEWNIAGSWKHTFLRRLSVGAGLRLAVYHCGNYNRIVPLPRLDLKWNMSRSVSLYASYGRLMQFEKLVEETTASLPADFRINACRRFRPQEVNSLEIGVEGRIAPLGLDYSAGGYLRLVRHAAEFRGSLMNLAGSSYDPLSDLMDGRGYSCGLSVILMKQFGRVRGRVGYNLGKSRLKFAEFGPEYFPSAHDRLHDLNLSLSWEPVNRLTFVASFTHATGLPYTRTKYGYMIGDNLICEYYPHNSSRLPAYNRLDLAVNYKFKKKGTMGHSLNLSVYNALCNKNIIFYYTSYTEEHGIRNRSSYLKTMIPTVTYTLTFN